MTKVSLWNRIKQAFYTVGSGYAYGGMGGGFFGGIQEGAAGNWQKNIVIPPRENLLAFAAIYSCIDLIARDVAKLRIKLMVQTQDGIWKETAVPAFSPVLRKPNSFQTRIQFMYAWVISKLMYGNTYVYKVRDIRNVVVAMYVLDPRRVTPSITVQGEVWYKVNADFLNDVPVENYFSANDIIHDRGPCLFHPLVGVSPIYACGMSAAQGIKIQQNSAAFFDNMSRPSGVLSGPDLIDEPTALRMKKQFHENFASGNLGTIMIAGSGLKYEPMTIAAVDAQLVDQLKWTSVDIAGTFHVPLYKLGGPMPPHTSVAALNQEYYTQCLQEYIESIELLLDEGLGLTGGTQTYGTELDLDGLLRMDQASLMTFLTDGVKGGVMAPDEARKRIDLPPVPGGQYPYLQQQNFSLEALAKRDASADPFKTSAPPAGPTPPANGPTPPEAPPPPKPGAKELADDLIRRFQEATREAEA